MTTGAASHWIEAEFFCRLLPECYRHPTNGLQPRFRQGRGRFAVTHHRDKGNHRISLLAPVARGSYWAVQSAQDRQEQRSWMRKISRGKN